VGVFVWICLSQFPIPVAHSHQAIAVDDVRLASHIDLKHHAGNEEIDHLHWHLLMPWEIAGEGDEDERSHHSPLGLWGAEGSSLPHSETAVDAPTVPRLWTVYTFDDRSCPRYPSPQARLIGTPASFLQTYAGVPLCTLVCVSLR
jgi:hypothetical protein